MEILEQYRDHPLTLLVQNAPGGILIVDRDGRILWVNKAIGQALGRSPQEVAGSSILDLIHRDDRPAMVRQILSPDDGSRESFSCRLRYEDGHWGRFDLTVGSFPGDENILTVIHATDTTEKHHARLREARLRTELRESQKWQAFALVAEAEAHDLFNLLTSIGTAATVLGRDLPGKASSVVEKLISQTEWAMNSVMKLLAAATERRKQSSPMDLRPLIWRTADVLRRGLPADAEIHVHAGSPCPEVVVHEEQIQRILTDVCAGGIAGPGSSVEIALATVDVNADMVQSHPNLEPGPYLRLSLKCGIRPPSSPGDPAGPGDRPPQRLARSIPWQKLDLRLVQAVARSHGGAVEMERGSPEGSTFLLYLPAVTAGSSD